MSKQPQVLWAQRESLLFITIEVDEAKIEKLEGEGNKLHFQGSSKTDKYETTLEFFDEIDASSVKHTGSSTRVVEITIQKKKAAWWPRLLQTKGKVHWLKVDFGKWKDEDEEEETEDAAAAGVGGGLGNGFDLNQYMSTLQGGAGGADFEGLDDEDDEYEFEAKDDDEDVYNPHGPQIPDMPDLEDNEEEDEGKAEIKA